MVDVHPDPGRERTSREISQLVDGKFHHRPDRFRRWVNWLSGLAFILILIFLAVAAAVGERRLYQAGPVTAAHRFVENDCQKCHTRWSPVARFNPYYGDISSVDEKKCTICHEGAPHYAAQTPPHGNIACVTCHREHRTGDFMITHANTYCIACHEDLSAHFRGLASTADAPPSTTNIANSVTSFGKNHPEFAVLDAYDDTPLRFNHKVHLHAKYDETGQLVEGLLNEQGQFEDLSRDCTVCHEHAAGDAYIRPIRYQAHCQRCHPLLFDNENFPGQSVPHGLPGATVRGFLTDLYVARALQSPATLRVPARSRPLPGRPDRSLWKPEIAEAVSENVNQAVARLARTSSDRLAEAEQLQQRGVHALLGNEALGGCRLCHELREIGQITELGPGGSALDVQSPAIPYRWLANARFSHDSHRFLRCVECHQDFRTDPPLPVTESVDTGDVLLPSINVCRTCHGERSSPWFAFGAAARSAGVSARCTDCHNYHDRRDEDYSGMLDVRLTRVVTPGENDN